MAVRNYSLKDVQCIFGPVIMGGYGDAGGIKVEYDENEFEFTPHADGGGTRSANNNTAAKITITLAQSSEANLLLSGIRTTDRLTGGGVLPLLIRDKNGTSIHAATSAWIEKSPVAEYSKAVTTREWILRTDDLSSVFGSNNEAA